MHRPSKAAQMTTPCMLQTPETSNIMGVLSKTFTDSGKAFTANFSTYGSTEIVSNDVLTVEENTTVTTWYSPDLVAGCRIKRLTDGAVFEIVGEPENIEMRNMFSVCKVRRVRGGA